APASGRCIRTPYPLGPALAVRVDAESTGRRKKGAGPGGRALGGAGTSLNASVHRPEQKRQGLVTLTVNASHGRRTCTGMGPVTPHRADTPRPARRPAALWFS